MICISENQVVSDVRNRFVVHCLDGSGGPNRHEDRSVNLSVRERENACASLAVSVLVFQCEDSFHGMIVNLFRRRVIRVFPFEAPRRMKSLRFCLNIVQVGFQSMRGGIMVCKVFLISGLCCL